MISEAPTSGPVEITVHRNCRAAATLERLIAERYQVDVTVVAPPENANDTDRRRHAAAQAGTVLGSSLAPDLSIAVAWGATVATMARTLTPGVVPGIQLIQMSGAGNTFFSGAEYAAGTLGRIGAALGARVHHLGCSVFQICDYPAVETRTAVELFDLRDTAAGLGLELELGTRGVEPAHLHRYLELCDTLGAQTLRSMLNTTTQRPSIGEAVTMLKQAMSAFERAGMRVTLETYEQVATADLVQVIEGVGSDALGICLDPANCVAGLELPHDVVGRTAPYVKNMHIKDFAFTRQAGWIGFTLAGCPLGEGLLDYDEMITVVAPQSRGINQIVEHWLPWQDDPRVDLLQGSPMDPTRCQVSEEQVMTDQSAIVTVIGAGGKMGQRISNNLFKSDYPTLYCENSPQGRELVVGLGRSLTDTDQAVAQGDVVILAVPDVVLGKVSAAVVPQMKSGAILLTLDPAAAYANLLYKRDDIAYAVAHPCHPSVFGERTTKEEHADTFGGIAAPQEVVAAFENGNDTQRDLVEGVVRVSYGPALDVHWVSVYQLAVLEPTLVETVACMVGGPLKEALHETVHTVGVPEAAAKAMLFGHVQVALANTLRESNPFSDACLIAMDYGRESIVREDWKKILDDGELDKVITRMLHLDQIDRAPA